MNVLVINCGSSSIKFHLYKMPDEILLAFGKVEKKGNGEARFKYNFQGKSIQQIQKGFFFRKS